MSDDAELVDVGQFSKHLSLTRHRTTRVIFVGHRPDELLESDRGEQQ